MKTAMKMLLPLLGLLVVLSGCASMVTMFSGGSRDETVDERDAPSEAQETVETAARFTFYDSYANW